MSTQEQELGVAIWLAKHTNLSPKQIHSICPSVHEFKAILLKSNTCNLMVEAIDPIDEGILSQEDIESAGQIHLRQHTLIKRNSIKRYIPRILRHYIPGVIVWLKQHYPTLADKAIAHSLGTTPKRVHEVALDQSIQPVNPISVQILTEHTLRDLLGE